MPDCFTRLLTVFNVGSGKTKVFSGGIDSCGGTIHWSSNLKIKMPYQNYIIGKILNDDGGANGIAAFEEAQYRTASCQRIVCIGIATGWGRNAENAPEYLQYIFDKFHIRISIISQELEGYIAHKVAGEAFSSDMGGASTQVGFGFDGKYHCIKTPFGGENFHSASEEYLNNTLKSKGLNSSRYRNAQELSGTKTFAIQELTKSITPSDLLGLNEAVKSEGARIGLMGGPYEVVKGLLQGQQRDPITTISIYELRSRLENDILPYLSTINFETAKEKFPQIPDPQLSDSIATYVLALLEILNPSEKNFQSVKFIDVTPNVASYVAQHFHKLEKFDVPVEEYIKLEDAPLGGSLLEDEGSCRIYH